MTTQTKTDYCMKILRLLAVILTALTLSPAFGQTPAQSATTTVTRSPEPGAAMTRFNLDFPGGTPRQLVAAIQKATGKPLNAIVPDEFADTKLPPLKMNNVDAAQLFRALEQASLKIETYGNGPQTIRTSYGFRTQGGATLSDDTIWSFSAEKPPPPSMQRPKICRFYSLASELERGQTVDDITTAIQTGWKMLGDENPPKISFHKDTKLLIAVGEPDKLEIIDAVLNSLKPPPTAKLPEKPKTEQ
jgi:hypothetical protein